MKLNQAAVRISLIALAALASTSWADVPPKTEIVRIKNERSKPITIYTRDQYGQYKFSFSGGAFHSYSSQDGKEYIHEKQGWDDSFDAYSAPQGGAFILFKIQMGYEDASVVEASYCLPESTNLSIRKIEGFRKTWKPQFFWAKDGHLLYAAETGGQLVRIYDLTSAKFKEEVDRKAIDFGSLIKIDFRPL